MHEDKAKIIEALGKVFAMTEGPIDRAEYLYDSTNGAEIVVVYDRGGNVLTDMEITQGGSGCSMIFEVAHAVQADIVMGQRK